jgi:hypothetical protein
MPFLSRLDSFLQFRILSKAASVVRDVTIKLVDQLQAASQESSQRSRFVLGLFICPTVQLRNSHAIPP